MPLEKSSSDDAVHANIKREIAAGKPLKQAIAIALSTKDKAEKTEKPAAEKTEKTADGY
jgi:hypothetical protein